MRTDTAMTKLAPAAVLLTLLAVVPAGAETQETDAITLGSMAERADFVGLAEAVAPAEGEGTWTLRVTERWRGSGVPLEIRLRTRPAGLLVGAEYMVLAAAGEDAVYTPLSSTYGVRKTAGEEAAPLVAYTRAYVASLGAPEREEDASALRAHLVSSLASESSGVPFSAGRDLLRRTDLHAALTNAQRAEVSTAIARPRKPDADLASILLAGVLGDDRADAALVARLLDPSSRHLRRHITHSLALRATPALVQTLVGELKGATTAQRQDIANALGRLERPEALAQLLLFLRDPSVEVRVESAHGLGLLARAVRRAPADDAVPLDAERSHLDAAREPLRTVVNTAKSQNERKAAVWALAQIDTPESWALVRKMAAEHAHEDVRRFATQYLSRPRVALLLAD